ncbi:MAG: tetratricopeptide repeat protein [Cyclobacteriaceae bacterium]|nr:tetratricopeptide repeat protein [Cyclobacteriaceae bacterium]
MRKAIFALLFLSSFVGFGQATLQQSLPEELYSEGVDMMTNADYGSARQYFERYLATDDTQYKEQAEYNRAICALSLYNLDGEQLVNQFIEHYPTSQLALMARFEIGNYFFRDRNYKNAIIQFNQVDPKVLEPDKQQELHYKLGYSYFAIKGFDQAIDYFNKLKNSKGKYQVISAYYAGYIEFEQEKYDEAITDLKKAADDPALGASVVPMLASVYYQKGAYTDLIDYLSPKMTEGSSLEKNSQLSIFLAESYFYTNQYTRAIEYYDKTKDKLVKEASYNYAVCLSKTGNILQAIEVLKPIAGTKDETEISASYLLGQLYVKENEKLYALGAFIQIENVENKQIAEESHFLASQLAYTLGRTTQSIESLQGFLKKYPSSSHTEEAGELLANAFIETSDYATAISYMENLPQKNNRVKTAYQKATFYLGVEEYNDRQFRKAVENFTKSIDNAIDKDLQAKAHLYIAEAYSLGRRFDEAEPHYREVLRSSLGKVSREYLMARFGLGYCLYNQKKYEEAKTQFSSFINTTNEDNPNYGNALVRLADCEYVEKNYTAALDHYRQAINGIIKEKDYAYYQVGVILHLLSKYQDAVANLDRVISVYPSSPYWDDALFEKGSVYLEQGEYGNAITAFSRLIADKPRSKYVPYALEKRALSNFNKREYARTIADYELFLKSYPTHPSVNNVLLGLQQAYAMDGRSTDFNKTLREFKDANPDVKGLEGVEFDALKGYFNEGLYTKAEEGLKSFISNHPDDPRVSEGKYILAESLYRQQKNAEALKLYYAIANEGTYDLMDRVYERIADLEYANLNYSKAIAYYHKLSNNAISKNQQYRALMGLMKSHYFNSSYDSALYFADNLLGADGIRNEFVVAATMFKAKAWFAKGDYDKADTLFIKTTQLTQDENGAEAQYMLGEIKNLQKQYDASNEELYKVAEKYANYSEWLDKAFLLVADNFIGKGEYFQAKATLQSIIDNTTSDLTRSKAKNRLDWLIKKEENEKNVIDTLHVEVKDTVAHE